MVPYSARDGVLRNQLVLEVNGVSLLHLLCSIYCVYFLNSVLFCICVCVSQQKKRHIVGVRKVQAVLQGDVSEDIQRRAGGAA